MAWRPAKPPRSDRAQLDASGGREQSTWADSQDERYGPLVLERRVKDDGRGLILYAERNCEPE